MDLGIINSEAQTNETTRPVDAVNASDSQDKIFQERFNQLARRERMFRQQEAQFKQMQEKLAQYDTKFAKLKESPIEMLEEEGFKYEDILAKGLNNDPTTKLQQKIEQLEARLSERDSKESSRESEARKQQDLDYIREQLANNEEFDLINSLGAYSHIYDKMLAYNDEYGELPDMNEVAREIETDLLNRVSPLKSSKKIKSLFAEKQQQAEESVQGKMEDKMTTLSNNMSPSSVPNTGIQSEQERVKAAIEQLRRSRNI